MHFSRPPSYGDAAFRHLVLPDHGLQQLELSAPRAVACWLCEVRLASVQHRCHQLPVTNHGSSASSQRRSLKAGPNSKAPRQVVAVCRRRAAPAGERGAAALACARHGPAPDVAGRRGRLRGRAGLRAAGGGPPGQRARPRRRGRAGRQARRRGPARAALPLQPLRPRPQRGPLCAARAAREEVRRRGCAARAASIPSPYSCAAAPPALWAQAAWPVWDNPCDRPHRPRPQCTWGPKPHTPRERYRLWSGDLQQRGCRRTTHGLAHAASNEGGGRAGAQRLRPRRRARRPCRRRFGRSWRRRRPRAWARRARRRRRRHRPACARGWAACSWFAMRPRSRRCAGLGRRLEVAAAQGFVAA